MTWNVTRTRSYRAFMLLLPMFLLLLSSAASADADSREERGRIRFASDPGKTFSGVHHSEDAEGTSRLAFNPDKTFKIVQFTDTQDDQDLDPRTTALIKAVLSSEKPDLVVFTGDNIRSGPQTPEDVRKAIDNIVGPVDARGIPWFITFGNHDEDHTPVTGVDRKGMLAIYKSYPHNINQWGPEGVTGVGNMHALIYGSRANRPVFNVWGIDSGNYAPEKIAGQTLEDDFLLGWSWMPTWDWIKPDQVAWYIERSKHLERTSGNKVPSLMFFHIPLQEFRTMYENRERHSVAGERNEDECPGPFNSGLFAALLQRGDVKGVFVGHDHVNDYAGDYFGVMLGYAANTGFGTYGLGGPDNDRLRGVRVFVLHEDDPHAFETHMVYASSYGI